MLRARFRDEVAEEVNAAIDSYEAGSPTKGPEFEAEFRRIVREVKEHPESGHPTLRGARRRLLQGYPYSVIYFIEPDHVHIVALSHFSQQWGYWVERLDSE